MDKSTQKLARRPLFAFVATACVALAATVAQTATAQPAGGPGMGMGMMGLMDGGPGMGHPGPRGHHGPDFGAREIKRMLDLVKATPEQRAQIKTITDTARTEMQAQREAARKLHEQGRAIFAQPNIDAAAAEALRQQMLAQHDQVSKRALQVMLDVSAVLTPEQRKTLADRLAERRSRMERHHREHIKGGDGQPAR